MAEKTGFEIINTKEWTKKLAKFSKFTDQGIKDRLTQRAVDIEAMVRETAPVRSGFLKNNYFVDDSEINNFSIAVFTETEYAPFVEFGTSDNPETGYVGQEAQPHLQPAVEHHRNGLYAAIQKTVEESWKK